MKMKSPASAQDEQTVEADDVIVVASETSITTTRSATPVKSIKKNQTNQDGPQTWEMSAKDALKVNYLGRAKKDSLEPF